MILVEMPIPRLPDDEFPVIEISFNDKVLSKAQFPMFVAENGTNKWSRDSHPEKAHSPMLVTPDGILNSESDEHFANDLRPIDVTVHGITISLTFEHPSKQLSLIALQ